MDKPPRSFWQIWNMSFGFLGIQFGWGLQTANMFGSTTAEITAGELRITIPSRTLAVFDVR